MPSGTRTIVATFALGILLLGACSSSKNETPGSTSPTEVTTVAVALQEWAALTAVDEIGDILLGSTQSKAFTLSAGSYVLFCNIVDSGYVHYKLGMRIGFTVT